MSEVNDSSGQSAAELLSSELLDFCKYESLSEDGLREIIDRHGLTLSNNFPVSNYKFFRAACSNERITEGIIRYLLECFPTPANVNFTGGWSPLHYACKNKNVTLNIIRRLVDAHPDSVRSVNNNGNTPLHFLCDTRQTDPAAAMRILRFLLEAHPEALRHANNNGSLPIHMVASCWGKSHEFCGVLIEAYPGSERISNRNDALRGLLPFHFACIMNSVATVEYLYDRYPDAIAVQGPNGLYPIHFAIKGIKLRENPATAAEIVQFLLDCAPNQKLVQSNGKSLLRYAFWQEYDAPKIDAGIQIIKIIFDAHPEAIEDNLIAPVIHHYHQEVQAFINNELVYARQAKDQRLMTTPNDDGRLPLHTAIQNNVTLGSIKLLVKGNPHAVQSPDNSGALPLHIACEHHDSASVVEYLVELDTTTLDALDRDRNTALHCACSGAKYDTIALLLGKYDAVSVSKRNAQYKLPIELLWESDQVDRESVEYTDSIFWLLKAHPETIMNGSMNMKEQVTSEERPSQNGKKRKYVDADA